MCTARVFVIGTLVLGMALGSASAQFSVTDPATTARNAVIARIKQQSLDITTAQRNRLAEMAQRLDRTFDRYRATDPPGWRRPRPRPEDIAYAQEYLAALEAGDPAGHSSRHVMRTRDVTGALFTALTSDARAVVASALATLDAADSTLFTSTDQVGHVRAHGEPELRAINGLETDVLDPSAEQSTTAVLNKISGAVLLETRQQQARLQLLVGLVEHLVVENKRARDTEVAALNMRLLYLRTSSDKDRSLLAHASDDLRTWRQP